MVRAAALVLTLALMSDSASAGTAEVSLVNDAAAVSTCERVGEVRGSSMMGGILTNAAYGRALEQMKKRAAKLGATHVQLLNASSGYAGSNMLGVAFKCAPLAMPALPPG